MLGRRITTVLGSILLVMVRTLKKIWCTLQDKRFAFHAKDLTEQSHLSDQLILHMLYALIGKVVQIMLYCV